MSTAFMVDSILQEKDVVVVNRGHRRRSSLSRVSAGGDSSVASVSGSEDSEFEEHVKDSGSLCDSPKSFNSCLNVNNSSFSDDELGPATVLRSYNGHTGSERDENGMLDYCCGKCGHYQSEPNPAVQRVREAEKDHGGGRNCSPGESGDCYEFRCEKCGYSEFIASKQTILKEVAKPVLKFSVSAILGDRKECVKVRNVILRSSELAQTETSRRRKTMGSLLGLYSGRIVVNCTNSDVCTSLSTTTARGDDDRQRTDVRLSDG
ncbi:hypothetical protein pipiens_001397 [Culex pipiens pipiens]|uniref:Uncharacterized protein n=1 Tax=Culex pipiens pipiens TaxID=38569 RepID=A0ABD1CZR9_CULPP